MDESRTSVSLVIPLYNEEEMLPLLVEELEKYRQKRSEIIEVVFVNDGSKDKTEQLARELTRQKSGYKLISFSRNFGHQIAVTAGLDYVETDAAIIMDADLQDPLEVAGEMIDKWKEGYDVVYGVRKKREGESVFKRTTASVFYRFFRWITELDIPLDTGDFRLVSKKVIKAYQQVTEQQPFVRGLITWLGYNQIGVEYHRQSRQAGETKYPLKKMMNLAFNAITSFSEKPLRLATQVGSMLSGLAFLGIIWVLYVRLFTETTVPGWASSLLIALFMGGVQILFLGVIGAYLARIYNEVRQRPRYLVKQIWRSDS
jgi:dolichol-phosphate mannosyltransferase